MAMKFLMPFFSSAIAIILFFLLIGALYRAPDFFSSTRFLLPLIGCSTVSALILMPSRSLSWILRVALAAPIAVALFFLVILTTRLFAA
jgi:hypothetical protein